MKNLHRRIIALLLCILCSSRVFAALTSDQLLLIVNQNEPEGAKLASYYAKARGVPPEQVMTIDAPTAETIDFDTYEKQIAAPVRAFIKDKNLTDKVKCMVTFYGVPLRIGTRQLSEPDKAELADLRQQRDRLQKQLSSAATKIEALAKKAKPQFQPGTGDALPQLRDRLREAANTINQSLPTITDETLKSAIMSEAVVLEQAMLVPTDISTQPSTLPAGVDLETLAKDRDKLSELQLRPFDPDSRKLVRAASRVAGLLQYLETIDNQVEYLTPDGNEACVDSELALVNWVYYPRTRWIPNPLCPTNRMTNPPPVFMTARLDAPKPEMVQRMIDDSIAVERDGLKGKVVIDSRGLPPRKADGSGDPYGVTDEQLRNLTRNLRMHTKLEVVADDSPNVILPKSVSDVAIYCGWYSPGVYVQSIASFSKGAVGYHIASYEMQSMHDPNYRGWVPNLIRDGIDGTLGPTYEPYLTAFPKPDDFFNLVLTGKLTMAEVFWRTAQLASWQVGYVGDPLYIPFKANPVFEKPDLARWLQPLLPDE